MIWNLGLHEDILVKNAENSEKSTLSYEKCCFSWFSAHISINPLRISVLIEDSCSAHQTLQNCKFWVQVGKIRKVRFLTNHKTWKQKHKDEMCKSVVNENTLFGTRANMKTCFHIKIQQSRTFADLEACLSPSL